jgi:23S rRNA (pseudouridine1915-N3)-methyltransferase
MKLRVVWVSPKSRSKEPGYEALTNEYLKRIGRYQEIETSILPDQPGVLNLIRQSQGRTQPVLVLLDSRGKELSSEQFAKFLDTQLSTAVQQVIFAIGPADGFSDEARRVANHILSLGRMTLPHELARVVLLEQIYRAFTILKGHPYHSGH